MPHNRLIIFLFRRYIHSHEYLYEQIMYDRISSYINEVHPSLQTLSLLHLLRSTPEYLHYLWSTPEYLRYLRSTPEYLRYLRSTLEYLRYLRSTLEYLRYLHDSEIWDNTIVRGRNT